MAIDETRDRPAEIDFGPGALDHRISADAARRAAILKVLTEYGFSPGSDPHSWRCYHPDRYGDCDCAEQVADALLALGIAR